MLISSLVWGLACSSSTGSGGADGGSTANGGTGAVNSRGGAGHAAGALGSGASAGAAMSHGGTSAQAGASSAGSSSAGASAGGASSGGASSGGAANGGAASGGASNGGASNGGASNGGAGGASNDVCTRWKADRADLSEGTWSGNVAACDAGDLSANARTNALRLVNLYRFLADLPAVTNDATLDAGDQACALMMRANNALNHTPPTTWTCYTKAGADAAGSSNIDSGPAVGAVDAYMIDSGNETTLGHRRWVLSNSLGPIGIGGTDKASCMHTLGGTGKAGKAWMAWPAPGTIPLQAMTPAKGPSVDTTGWSIQSEKIDLTNAVVKVTVGGADQPVKVTQLLQNYGAKYALDFIPQGWKTQAGKTYSVAVTGIATPINYDVQIVDCK